MTLTSVAANGTRGGEASEQDQEYITMIIAGQLFGLPVLSVQDVLGPHTIAKIPMAPREIAGSLNLRGRVVTAIDMRRRLQLPEREESQRPMSVVVDHDGELYSLLIDNVGEVLSLDMRKFERNPPTMAEEWRCVSSGIFQREDALLVVLDIDRILDFDGRAADG